MLFQKINEYFNLDVQFANTFVRRDGNQHLSQIIETMNGDQYFLKQVPIHSQRKYLDNLYYQLANLKVDNLKLILPLNLHQQIHKFTFEVHGISYLLFKKANLLPFDINKYSLDRLIKDLNSFQNLIQNFNLIKSRFRNYESWLNRGILRVTQFHGKDLPYINSFNQFMNDRFHQIEFIKGNIHWDIHLENLALDEVGNLIIMDFDLLGEGSLITDFAAAASLYIDIDNPVCDKNLEIYQTVFQQTENLYQGLDLSEFKFLIKRNFLGDSIQTQKTDQVIRLLTNLEIV